MDPTRQFAVKVLSMSSDNKAAIEREATVMVCIHFHTENVFFFLFMLFFLLNSNVFLDIQTLSSWSHTSLLTALLEETLCLSWNCAMVARFLILLTLMHLVQFPRNPSLLCSLKYAKVLLTCILRSLLLLIVILRFVIFLRDNTLLMFNDITCCFMMNRLKTF